MDRRPLPARLQGCKWDGRHDPEGLLSTHSCRVGGCPSWSVLAGVLLYRNKYGPWGNVVILIVGAPILYQRPATPWGFQFPIIKKLWTSSFVLLTTGISAVLLGLFYLVVDVIKFRIWAAPFVWIGMNAITLYLVWNLFEDGFPARSPPPWSEARTASWLITFPKTISPSPNPSSPCS